MASWRTLLTLLIAALLGLFGCASPPKPHAAAYVPATRVRALDSSETQLTTALQGRPALITLWATWCDACQKEQPALSRLDTWAREHGAVIVGVAVGEPIQKVSTFASTFQVPYLLLVDEEFLLADALGEKRVPTTLVIDRDGRIVYTGGALDDRSLAAFRSLLVTTSARAE